MRHLVLCLAISILSTAQLGAQTPGALPIPMPPSVVGSRLFFSDTTNDAIYVARDLNSDGDFQDAGEIQVFYDDSSANVDLGLPKALHFGPDGALYVGDSSADVILRLEDTDGDGNANGPNDSTVFFDSSSSTPAFTSLGSMGFDGDGYLFFTDSGAGSSANQSLVRIRDDNGDGFCSQAAGEVLFVHEQASTTGVAGRWAGMAFDSDGSIIVMEYGLAQDDIYRLVDLNGDGDSNDAGEQILYFNEDPAGTLITLTFVENMARGYEIPGQGRPMWVNNYTADQFLRFLDTNGDDYISNDSEVTIFWDVNQADGVIPGITWGFALDPSGKIYIAEGGSTSAGTGDSMVVLEDLNGDGDANDTGEAIVVFDDTNLSGFDFGTVRGIALEPALGTQPPTLLGVTPNTGSTAGGTVVSLTGTGFTAGDTVTFDGLPAFVTFNSPGQLTATTPAHAAGSVDVVVANANGSSTLTGGFTYAAPPVLSSLAPSSGSPLGGTIVTLTGSNFTPGDSVTFDGAAAVVTYDNSNQLTVTTPAGSPGAVAVTVSNATGTSTLGASFTYEEPPLLASISPATGATAGGTTVTLSGSGFTAADVVTFDGLAATVAFNSPMQLTVTTPPHAAGAVDVVVANVNGTSSLAAAFTYEEPFPNFTRGDCNGDGSNNIADPIFLLGYLFPGTGGANVVECFDACDGNDDEALNIADAVAMLGALFGTPTVPLSAPNGCGPDPSAPSDDPVLDLDCSFYPSCP
ncbi:MAG: IPT/TIG domain-containing protein [Planctomycetota bacterium]